MTPARVRGKLIALPPPEPALAQLDLFPSKPVVDHLDPKKVVGPRTAVRNLVRVRMRATEAPHVIFHDRHGWYCEAHGADCAAVQLAQNSVRNDE